MKTGPHPLLALDKVRYVGDPVARDRRRDLPAGQGRGRGARGRLRRARPAVVNVGDAHDAGALVHDEVAEQPDLRLGAGRQGRDRRGVRQGRPRHQDRPGQQPAGARTPWSRAPRSATTTPAPTASPATSPARTRTCTGWSCRRSSAWRPSTSCAWWRPTSAAASARRSSSTTRNASSPGRRRRSAAGRSSGPPTAARRS